MCKMTIVHLGVIVYAICLTTQVVSQNSTGMTSTSNSSTPTTMATDAYSGSTNSTSSPSGVGLSLHTATSCSALLATLVAAASFLQSLS